MGLVARSLPAFPSIARGARADNGGSPGGGGAGGIGVRGTCRGGIFSEANPVLSCSCAGYLREVLPTNNGRASCRFTRKDYQLLPLLSPSSSSEISIDIASRASGPSPTGPA